jgi:hypothetical protein
MPIDGAGQPSTVWFPDFLSIAIRMNAQAAPQPETLLDAGLVAFTQRISSTRPARTSRPIRAPRW